MVHEKLWEPSRYLEYFASNAEWLRENGKLVGDVLIVERLKFPEKRVGSLIMVDSKSIQSDGLTCEIPAFFRVLLIGEGHYDDATGADVPLDVSPGDILYMASGSLKMWSSFPLLETADSDILGICRYGDALWHWKGEAKFIEFLRGFNSTITKKIQLGSAET